MKLATILIEGKEEAAVASEAGLLLLSRMNEALGTSWCTDIFQLLQQGQLEELTEWVAHAKEDISSVSVVPYEEALFMPLYRHPRKIWGVGMNYCRDQAELASIPAGTDPVSFMKPDTSIIGPDDSIMLPAQSQQVTAEAELAIIIGKTCKDITEAEAYDVIAGYTTALDMTAADIHAENQRYLTRAKSFDTFFSFGPQLVTKDEVLDVSELIVETVCNEQVYHQNTVAHMRYRPEFIVAYHSQVMTLLPGDIIITGTPGAVIIRDGDRVGCRISGMESLYNVVCK